MNGTVTDALSKKLQAKTLPMTCDGEAFLHLTGKALLNKADSEFLIKAMRAYADAYADFRLAEYLETHTGGQR